MLSHIHRLQMSSQENYLVVINVLHNSYDVSSLCPLLFHHIICIIYFNVSHLCQLQIYFQINYSVLLKMCLHSFHEKMFVVHVTHLCILCI
jgi:hypothetical protein